MKNKNERNEFFFCNLLFRVVVIDIKSNNLSVLSLKNIPSV